MELHALVKTSNTVAATPGRLEKTALLTDTLRRLPLDEIAIGVDYLAGNLRQGRIGLGGAIVAEAMRAPAAARPVLTLPAVDAAFARIAAIKGAGSGAGRRGLLHALFSQATAEEQHFLAHLILGELRQGALEGVMVEAIARAASVPAAEVRRAVMVTGDLAVVAQAALGQGLAGLGRFAMRLLQPVKPMLAQTAGDVSEALRAFGRAAFEYKLDGARVQAHKRGDEVRVFTRRLNDVTEAVPEIVEALRALPAHGLILDGEALALRPDGGPQPFQLTMRRFGRRLDVARLRRSLPLHVFFFDCLHRDGDDLIARPAAERYAALAEALPAGLLIPRLVTGDAGEAEAFLGEALARGHEGVMAKALDAPYEAGSRGSSWRKIKPAFTLDLVVLAAEWGHGRRQGWLSNLHLGARDPASGGFVMLGKTFKGMTDDMLAWQTQRLRDLQVASDGHTVRVRPELVVEVAFNDIQASPQYPGGLALRFARVRHYRPDKRPEEADTIDAVRAIFARQTGSG